MSVNSLFTAAISHSPPSTRTNWEVLFLTKVRPVIRLDVELRLFLRQVICSSGEFLFHSANLRAFSGSNKPSKR